MPRIKDQTQQLGIGHVQQAGQFIRALHKAGTMMMKHRGQARVCFHGPGDVFSAGGKDLPLRIRETHIGPCAPGMARAQGIGPIVIGQDQKGHLFVLSPLCDLGQEACDLQALSPARRMRISILQGHGHKGPQQCH